MIVTAGCLIHLFSWGVAVADEPRPVRMLRAPRKEEEEEEKGGCRGIYLSFTTAAQWRVVHTEAIGWDLNERQKQFQINI